MMLILILVDCLLKSGGKCFTYHVSRKNWWDARRYCKTYGGDLAGNKHYTKLIAITRSERGAGKGNFLTLKTFHL